MRKDSKGTVPRPRHNDTTFIPLRLARRLSLPLTQAHPTSLDRHRPRSLSGSSQTRFQYRSQTRRVLLSLHRGLILLLTRRPFSLLNNIPTLPTRTLLLLQQGVFSPNRHWRRRRRLRRRRWYIIH